ncbi:MAG: hypothetical protein L0Y76_12940 [Ignavibacteria bacterium]|nr:hypothetical protein [Ignavibacteria bacterium]
MMNYWKSRYSSVTGELIPDIEHKASRKTLSDFNKQIEKFLIWINLEKSELQSIIFLTREMRKRNAEKYFEQIISEIKITKSEKHRTGFQNILHRAELNFEEYLMYNSRNDEENMLRIAKERTELSTFAIAHSKLFEYINSIYLSPDKKYHDTGRFNLNETTEFLKKNRKYYMRNFPNVWTLYLIYEAINNSFDYKKINSAYSYFKKNEKSFSEEFLQFGYDYILKLYFSLMDKGDHRAISDFYKVLLNPVNSGAIDKIHHLQSRLFPGFILIAINNGNLALAEKIISKYSDKIVASLRGQVSRICMGIIELAKGNYDKVRNLLEGEKPRDSMLNIFCKTTLIKAYFEKGDFRNIYPLSDTLKHFLKRRQDISGTHSNVIKFLNYTSKLAQIKKKNGKGLDYIETALLNEKYFFQKNWVVQKFNEIKAGA